MDWDLKITDMAGAVPEHSSVNQTPVKKQHMLCIL